MSHDATHTHEDHKPAGFLNRWLFTTNHKDIGTLYLVFSLLMFLIGGSMAMIIRAELFMPGLQLVEPDFFNQMTTMHALIMVFGAVMMVNSYDLVVFKWTTQIPLIHLPEGLRAVPIMLCGVFIFLFSIGHMIHLFKGIEDVSDITE